MCIRVCKRVCVNVCKCDHEMCVLVRYECVCVYQLGVFWVEMRVSVSVLRAC